MRTRFLSAVPAHKQRVTVQGRHSGADRFPKLLICGVGDAHRRAIANPDDPSTEPVRYIHKKSAATAAREAHAGA